MDSKLIPIPGMNKTSPNFAVESFGKVIVASLLSTILRKFPAVVSLSLLEIKFSNIDQLLMQ